ncbi:MAG: CbiX/SirB N-terminal domain-containing protein [Bermanella sp.]
MKALLLIVHGSRKASSTTEIAHLSRAIAQQSADFNHVRHCFLELAQPKPASSIHELVALGCEHIVLLPYFLAQGFHVAQDLPKLLQQAQQDHPQITFDMLEHFGAAQQMPNWVLEYVKTHH